MFYVTFTVLYVYVSPMGPNLQGFQLNSLYIYFLPTRATCPAHLIILDLVTPTTPGEQYMP